MVVYSVFVPGDPNVDKSYNLFVKCAVNWNISTWEIDLNLFCEHEAQLKYKKNPKWIIISLLYRVILLMVMTVVCNDKEREINRENKKEFSINKDRWRL